MEAGAGCLNSPMGRLGLRLKPDDLALNLFAVAATLFIVDESVRESRG